LYNIKKHIITTTEKAKAPDTAISILSIKSFFLNSAKMPHWNN